MSAEQIWQRATLLFDQQRWDLATTELRRVLSQEPDHAPAHALLALALLQQNELDGALQEARVAIGLDPELDFAHRAFAAVLLQREEYEAAAVAIGQAIELDPDDAQHRSLLAQIRLAQRRWQDALDAANGGLELDPRHTDCLNLRSVALTRLGRGQEASDTLDASLAHDPDNPYTHQARGFALLHRGDARAALVHFQEALRRDPTLDGARQGLLEALKARNPIYRLLLGWFLWLDRFDRKRQFQILIGLWLLARIAGQGLRGAGYATAGTVVSYAWLLFVLVTACAVPVFNLLLLLHPLGRHALDRQSRNDAIVLGVALAVAIGVSGAALLAPALWSYAGWLFWWLLLLPVAGIGLFGAVWGRRALQALVAVLVLGWFWWAFSIERTEFVDSVDATSLDANRAAVKLHLDWMFGLQITAALSTWFVLFAPKGRRRTNR